MTRENGFGSWPDADEVARIGGPTGPVIPDGGGESFPGDVADLPRALRRRIETTLAAGETTEAFLAHAWTTHQDAPAVDSLADAARFECHRRDLELDTVRLTPEVELPRATWERIWHRFLDSRDRREAGDTPEIGDLLFDYVEVLPTFIVPADPERGREELVVDLGEWPVVPRDRDGEPLEADVDEDGEGADEC